MDVRLSPEQKALQDSVAQVVDRLGVHAVGELDDVERAAKLDAAVVASGWRELRAEGDAGAPLASAVEAALVAEELARGLADSAFLGPTLAADLRRRAGAPAANIPETVLLAADLGSLACADVPDGDSNTDGGWTNLPGAALAVDGPGTTALALIPAGDAFDLGRALTAMGSPRTDLTRLIAEPATSLTPVPDTGPLTRDDITAWTALGLALTTADLVGSMRGAVDLATAYAKDRRQYGTAIGAFQAVQHLLADALVAVEGSRSVARHAAWAVDALAPAEALAAASLAKAYAARAARTVCETAIQVHGGIGNTWECAAHLHLRRVLLSTDVLGGVGPCLEQVLAHQGIGGPDGLS